jgi:hypothetical protein
MDISRSNYKIDLLYRLALEEGEGFGTAYEYFVKIKLLLGLLGKHSVQSILMAGLPEKYGFSLDVFLLANLWGSKVLVADTDAEKLGRAERLIKTLDSKKILSCRDVEFRKVDGFCDVRRCGHFDLSVSSLVVQRLAASQRLDYIDLLANVSRSVIMFAPNRSNEAHVKITALNSVSIADIKGWSELFSEKMLYRQYGLLDMPPFPPGIKLDRSAACSHDLRDKIGSKILELWAIIEKICPYFIKKKIAHIAYLFVAEA